VDNTLHLCDLPDGIFTLVSEYLAKPSSALFAVAVTSKSWRTKVGFGEQQQLAILSSSSWDALDLGDIDNDVAEKLTDDDIFAMLMCIDAKQTLKTLKLSGCVNITGRGLEPLRGSTVIEHIDLSLVKQHESPNIDPVPPISKKNVLPILDSIVTAEGSSLKLMVLPKKWRTSTAETTELIGFLHNYKQLLESRRHRCLQCDSTPGTSGHDAFDSMIEVAQQDPIFGLQNYVCHKCFGNFCYDCGDGDGEGPLGYCEKCERDYCQMCVSSGYCNACNDSFCSECSPMKECSNCHDIFCATTCCWKEKCATCNDRILDICKDCGEGRRYFCDECFRVTTPPHLLE